MNSHEVLKKAVTEVGAKSVASDMNLSSSLIYKWCEPSEPEGAGGADNPLDRLLRIYELTGDTGPIAWLCQRAGGYYVANQPPVEKEKFSLLPTTRRILREFTELLDAVSESMEDDGKIDGKEAERIRAEWEDLKSIAEGFVTACEKGTFAKRKG
jgi:hypothetical protein